MPAGLDRALRVLVVDDDESVHDMVDRVLGDAQLEHAHNGIQALQALSTRPHDIVLLDVNLPDTSGLELLGTISARAGAPVVVMLSTDDRPDTVRVALERGARRSSPSAQKRMWPCRCCCAARWSKRVVASLASDTTPATH